MTKLKMHKSGNWEAGKRAHFCTSFVDKFKEQYKEPESVEDCERSDPAPVWRLAPFVYAPLALRPRNQQSQSEAEQYLKKVTKPTVYAGELLLFRRILINS